MIDSENPTPTGYLSSASKGVGALVSGAAEMLLPIVLYLDQDQSVCEHPVLVNPPPPASTLTWRLLGDSS